MNYEELYDHRALDENAFEAAELMVLKMGLKHTFREKLEWLEQAETLLLEMRAAQAQLKNRADQNREG